MDPNEALKRLRNALKNIRATPEDEDLCVDDVDELMSSSEALDEWLTNGGFLPDDWKQS